MLRPYFYKLLRSPLFYMGFLASLALSLYSMYKTGGRDVFTNLDILIGLQSYRKMFILFAALPFASNFADEWNSKTIVNCVTRKNAGKYAFSNAVMCYLSAFATVFAGMMIYVLIQSTRMPLCDTAQPLAPPYGILFQNGTSVPAITLIVFVYALSCGMWAVMGLAASAFFPSKYIAICAPFVFCYITERFTEFFPEELQLGPLSKSWSEWTPLPAFLKSFLILLAISAVCGIIFTVRVKRRIENELY